MMNMSVLLYTMHTNVVHPGYFQRLPRLGSVTARHVVVGVSQTLRRWTEGGGRHLCSAGRPSRWALAQILVVVSVSLYLNLGYVYFYGDVSGCLTLS